MLRRFSPVNWTTNSSSNTNGSGIIVAWARAAKVLASISKGKRNSFLTEGMGHGHHAKTSKLRQGWIGMELEVSWQENVPQEQPFELYRSSELAALES